MLKSESLSAKIEPFDTFWEGPDEVEKGYKTLYKFYKQNYLQYMPPQKGVKTLVISCGPGYFVYMLNQHGYTNVFGTDSDGEKIQHAKNKGLNCQQERAFEFLHSNKSIQNNLYDVIIAEQEINHLTKEELMVFLKLCRDNLKEGGTLMVHSLNGANPITGSEALAQNFNHFTTMTEYSLKQVLEFSNFTEIKVFPLNLYVFYSNPFNYVAIVWDRLNAFFFRLNFKLYGKENKIFTKKIAAVCKKYTY